MNINITSDQTINQDERNQQRILEWHRKNELFLARERALKIRLRTCHQTSDRHSTDDTDHAA